MGATVCRYALSIFIIRIFLRFVKGQTGVFFGLAVLTKFGRLCYNKALGHTENGRRLIHAPRRECMHMKLDMIVKLVSIVCDVFKAYLAYLNSQNKRK